MNQRYVAVNVEKPGPNSYVTSTGTFDPQPAEIIGPLAITPGLEDDGMRWTLTHIMTGRRVTARSSKRELREIAEQLVSRFPHPALVQHTAPAGMYKFMREKGWL